MLNWDLIKSKNLQNELNWKANFKASNPGIEKTEEHSAIRQPVVMTTPAKLSKRTPLSCFKVSKTNYKAIVNEDKNSSYTSRDTDINEMPVMIKHQTQRNFKSNA